MFGSAMVALGRSSSTNQDCLASRVDPCAVCNDHIKVSMTFSGMCFINWLLYHISSFGGCILNHGIAKYGNIAVFQPVINGVGGNLVAIQVFSIIFLRLRFTKIRLFAGKSNVNVSSSDQIGCHFIALPNDIFISFRLVNHSAMHSKLNKLFTQILIAQLLAYF